MIRNSGIVHFFDKLEDKIRIALSRRPILYAFIGGVGVVLFWKGVWETAEFFSFLDGPGSVALGMLIMLMTGLLVSIFIGDSIMLSGLNREKKLAEKTEEEVRKESEIQKSIINHLEIIEEKLENQEKLQDK